MKKEINVTVKGYICNEALNDYYVQLWRALRDVYGDDILAEISKMYDEEIQQIYTQNSIYKNGIN